MMPLTVEVNVSFIGETFEVNISFIGETFEINVSFITETFVYLQPNQILKTMMETITTILSSVGVRFKVDKNEADKV